MSRLRFWRRHDEIPVVELRQLKPGAGRDRVPRDPGDRRVLRLHQAHPVQTRLPSEGGVRDGPQHPPQVARAHRRASTWARSRSIQREGNAGLVNMEIEPKGLPIHTDATLKIRPRIFLEGNWFVELQPGSPSAHDALLRLHDPGHADLRPGAARPGARRAEHRHARQPAELPAGLRRRADAQADRRRKRRTGPGSARPERARRR